jgi:hypothetical protein
MRFSKPKEDVVELDSSGMIPAQEPVDLSDMPNLKRYLDNVVGGGIINTGNLPSRHQSGVWPSFYDGTDSNYNMLSDLLRPTLQSQVEELTKKIDEMMQQMAEQTILAVSKEDLADLIKKAVEDCLNNK